MPHPHRFLHKISRFELLKVKIDNFLPFEPAPHQHPLIPYVARSSETSALRLIEGVLSSLDLSSAIDISLLKIAVIFNKNHVALELRFFTLVSVTLAPKAKCLVHRAIVSTAEHFS